MRLRIRNKITGVYLGILAAWLVFIYVVFLVSPGSTVLGAAILFSFCWSTPCIFGLLFLVRRKYIWLEAKGARSQWTDRLTRSIPIVIGVLGFIIAIPIASDKYAQRCHTFEPNRDYIWCDLTGVDASNTSLNGSSFDKVTLDLADFSGSNLQETSFCEASLYGADLSNADLSNADLRDADLSRANLSGATLSDANLNGATLSGVDLSGAILDNADLGGADLHDAIGLTDTMLASLGNWRGLVLEDRNQIVESVGAACRGEPVPAAASLGGTLQFHPLILLDGQGEQHPFTHQLVKEWWPARTSHAQLVVCVDRAVSEKRYCNYTNNISMEFTRYGIEVRLIEVQTARQIRSITIWPDDTCPSTVVGEPGDRKKGASRELSAGDVVNALQSYIHFDGSIEPLTIDVPVSTAP